MRTSAALAVLFAPVAGLIGLTVVYTDVPPAVAPAPHGPARVKLAVLLVFDQMRGDYPERWKSLYGKGGFARFQSDGLSLTECHYPYAITTTGPGHASMLTGTCGDRHGIVSNNWLERGANTYCAGSTRYQFVPPLPKKTDDEEAKVCGSPDRLLAETVADVLRASRPGAKIFGLSLKDRSAILPTGKRPDGAYWFLIGRFVTSTYYADRVHPWVEAFNASGAADRWYGKEWTRFRADLDYAKHGGPDKVAGEGVGVTVKEGPAKGWNQGGVFPHPMSPPVGFAASFAAKPDATYYSALANSPFGNELLLALAKECVTAEQLGADDVPDLLVVSFSSNDLIGHTWGPDSQEVLDVTLRTDALLADLFAFLDEKVGKDRYLVGLTADHGVCPLPEVSRGKKIDAKRVDPKALQKAVEEHLTAKFGAPPGSAGKATWVEATLFPWFYINPKVVTAVGRTRAEVSKEAAEFLATRPEVQRTFTRADLEGTFRADDAVGNQLRRSYHPTRCGDVCAVLKPYYLPTTALATGTVHGTPYEYDTHVPFMLYGPGVGGGTRRERTTPQAMAAVFAKWLGVRPPDRAEFPIPESLEK